MSRSTLRVLSPIPTFHTQVKLLSVIGKMRRMSAIFGICVIINHLSLWPSPDSGRAELFKERAGHITRKEQSLRLRKPVKTNSRILQVYRT